MIARGGGGVGRNCCSEIEGGFLLVFHYLYLILPAITHPRTRPFLTQTAKSNPQLDTILDHPIGEALPVDQDGPVLDARRVVFKPCRRLLVVWTPSTCHVTVRSIGF